MSTCSNCGTAATHEMHSDVCKHLRFLACSRQYMANLVKTDAGDVYQLRLQLSAEEESFLAGRVAGHSGPMPSTFM